MRASTDFVRAGNWVFGTGLRGLASPELFRRIETGLRSVGSSLARVVRLDQYYPDLRCVAAYQAARKQAFRGRQVPPSTSVIVSRLVDAQAEVDVQVMAATNDSGYQLEEIATGLNRPEASGYAPALRCGDLIFVAGQLARDPAGKLAVQGVAGETEYIVRQRLVPALEASGSALDLVLKAQVYLSRPEPLPAFRQYWKAPTTVVALRHPAFLTTEATVEINVIAAHRSARMHGSEGARIVDGLVFTSPDALEHSHVVRALYFQSDLSGLRDPGVPYSAFQVQGESTIDLWGYTS